MLDRGKTIDLGNCKFNLEVEFFGEHGEFSYQTLFSSCADLCAQAGDENIMHGDNWNYWNPQSNVWTIPPGERATIGTGLRIVSYVPMMTSSIVPEILIRPRSSFTRLGMMVHLGTVDMDYRGEICVNLENNSKRYWIITPGDRIAQATMGVTIRMPGVEVKKKEREGGFGSTGV